MGQASSLKKLILVRLGSSPPNRVWTPVDFLDLGTRASVDKTLQRLVNEQALRRIDRGLYDKPQINALTKKPNVPDYREVIDAVSRRDQIRALIDGMSCANDLGLTNAVPAKVIVHTEGRLRPIHLGKLIISFKPTAASKLYWAGRPGMRIVQALFWMHDTLEGSSKIDQEEIQTKLTRYLRSSQQGQKIRDDLQLGLHTVPTWMQGWIRKLLAKSK